MELRQERQEPRQESVGEAGYARISLVLLVSACCPRTTHQRKVRVVGMAQLYRIVLSTRASALMTWLCVKDPSATEQQLWIRLQCQGQVSTWDVLLNTVACRPERYGEGDAVPLG